MFTGLPVHLPDRRARLDFIHRGVLAARKANELAGPELLDEWLEMEGWPQAMRSQLLDEFEAARSLLILYDEEAARR